MQVAIAGAGIVGAAIAYELSQVPGLELCVFEACPQPATGATGAALGVMMGIISQKTKGRAWRLREQAVQRYDSLIAELEDRTGQSILYNRQGIVSLRFAPDERLERWQTLQAQRQAQGYKLELWDRDTLLEHCPHITHPDICGAVYSPGDRQVDPVALTQVLLQAAQLNDVQVHYNQPLKRDSQGELRDGAGEAIATDAYILTAGLGTVQLVPDLDLRPVLGQAWRVKLSAPLGQPDFQPVITGEDVLVVPLGAGHYWLGATVEFPDEAGMVVAQAEAKAEFWRKALRFFPALAEAEITAEWSGLRPRPWGQGAPVIMEVESDRPTLVAAGHYRNGVLLAPGTAQVVKDWVLGLG
ncbi:MAG: FAD-binding oxidoreductase [Spirulina sp. SIO3F2]|nr:FAD-binding oxidoreductase [Spirulina sp. SIO3F2]